ncbi:MAG: nucleotidyltransferase domain-containing protein [Lentisphaeraceae bacterium]|nr:nucleotidyltransferase domain-containing protein [Lentisphaeraceae bacterium]
MKPQILETIKTIEAEKNVNILYACESGSRAWGFSSNDSDYDVRFIYTHEKDYYLSVFTDRRDVIELPIDDLLDVNGWDLKKVLSLLYKNNLALFEWINSPVVYVDKGVKETLIDLVNASFRVDRAHYHYFSMANGFYKDHIVDKDQPNMKKLFYCLRSTFACLWVNKYNTMPPVNFNKMLIPDLANQDLIEEIQFLMKEKLNKGEGDCTDKCKLSKTFIEDSLGYLSELNPLGNTPDKNRVDETFKSLLNTYGNF